MFINVNLSETNWLAKGKIKIRVLGNHYYKMILHLSYLINEVSFNMKFFALLLASITWLFCISLMRIKLKFFYSFHNFKSKAILDFKVFFAHLKVELDIPKEMLLAGLGNIFGNIAEDMSQEKECDIKKERPYRKKAYRYHAIKNFVGKVFRYYIFSWSQLIWIKRTLYRLYKYFYKRINIYSFNVAIEVGGRDAAETGLLVGALWSFFGQMKPRLHRLVTVKDNKMGYSVVPRFNEEIFLGKLNCILSLKISHIIFTAYKFLLFILKNRRIRNYGRTSN